MRFRKEFSLDEHVAAQKILERQALSSGLGCAGTIFGLLIFTVVKVATIQFSFVLLPFVFLAFYAHSCLGIRFWRARSGARLVVWLRRFHRADLRRFPSGTMIQSICSGAACPLTIQDSTYQTSWHSLVSRGTVVLVLVGLTALAASAGGLFAGLIALVAVLTLFGAPQSAIHAILGAGAVLGFPICLYFIGGRIMRRACFTRLRRNNFERVTARLIDRARAGRATSTLQIFQCDDDFWQAVVRQSLAAASAVVLDVSELNANVEWELRQVRECVAPERIVLCCAARGGRLICDEAKLVERLQTLLGSHRFERASRVTYDLPPELPAPLEFLARRLRDFPAVALSLFAGDYIQLQRALALAIHSNRPN